ncbi:MAG: hypothetical protein ACFWUE_01895 [Xylanivirga thermophila]|jgi:hypothetical protein
MIKSSMLKKAGMLFFYIHINKANQMCYNNKRINIKTEQTTYKILGGEFVWILLAA